MDAKVKGEWVAALRSGKYRQGQHCLSRRDNSKHVRYCCLGVLCEITPDVKRVRPNPFRGDHEYVFEGASSDTELPSPLRQSMGITRTQEGDLINMNDDGQPFSQIADWIEKNL